MSYEESQIQSQSERPMEWTEELFTKHVGAESFHEAIEVTLRSARQDADKIEWMFNKLKEQGRIIDALNQAAIDSPDFP